MQGVSGKAASSARDGLKEAWKTFVAYAADEPPSSEWLRHFLGRLWIGFAFALNNHTWQIKSLIFLYTDSVWTLSPPQAHKNARCQVFAPPRPGKFVFAYLHQVCWGSQNGFVLFRVFGCTPNRMLYLFFFFYFKFQDTDCRCTSRRVKVQGVMLRRRTVYWK